MTQEVFDHQGPALLFENIKDHEDTLCKHFFTGSLASYSRIALMMGLPKDTPPKEIIRAYMERAAKPSNRWRSKQARSRRTFSAGTR